MLENGKLQTGKEPSIPGGYGGANYFYVGANHSTLTRLLQECDEPQIVGICSRVEFHLNILRKGLPLPKRSYLHDAPDYRRVGQCTSSVFAVSDLRFRMIESDGNVDVRLAQAEGWRQRICFQMGLQQIGCA